MDHNISGNKQPASSNQHQASRIKPILLGLSAFALIAIISILTRHWLVAKQEPLPVLGTVPKFALTERSGQQFDLSDLRGHIWVADFIFTNCAGTCPIMTAAMAELQTELTKQKLDDVKLVSITVDPARDTPEALAKFAERYGAQANRWYFLTGDSAAIQRLASQGFRLMSAVTGGGSAEEPIIHSDRFVIVDRQARIRGYYRGTEEAAVVQLLRDLKKLYREATLGGKTS
jgi:protein SCO1/2